MKILVFSDSHLTERFNIKKFQFLKKIIQESDLVIINGDFWDGYLTTFDRFISSDWNKLFPLLKSKKTVYLFGNHDKEKYTDKNINLFSTLQTHKYELKLNGKKFIFEHGNRLYPFIDDKSYMPRILNKINAIIAGFLLENVPLLKLLEKRVNEIIKQNIKKTLKENEIYIVGHSHHAEFDLKNSFINTGYIQNGRAQYLIIDDKSITPKEEWYD